MRLAAYDFIITHWSEKTNFINVLLRCSDYKVKKNINRLLLTLQQKLITLSQELKSSITALVSQINT